MKGWIRDQLWALSEGWKRYREAAEYRALQQGNRDLATHYVLTPSGTRCPVVILDHHRGMVKARHVHEGKAHGYTFWQDARHVTPLGDEP